MGIKQEIEWFDVRERLPEIDEIGFSRPVLVMNSAGEVVPAYWQHDGWASMSRTTAQKISVALGKSQNVDEEQELCSVVAWAEIPAMVPKAIVMAFEKQSCLVL